MKMKNSITILYFMVILNYRPMRLKKYLQTIFRAHLYGYLLANIVFAVKYFWSRPGPGLIILLTVAYNFIILSFDINCLVRVPNSHISIQALSYLHRLV